MQIADHMSTEVSDLHITLFHSAVMERHERLKLARERAGYKTAKLASTALGVPYGTYSGHEAGSRGIKTLELQQYAKRFRVSLNWLAFGEGELGGKQKPLQEAVTFAPVRGLARAGAWYEFEEFPSDDPEMIPVSDHRYKSLEQFAYLCAGPSMDRAGLPDGTYAICVAYWQVRSTPKEGDVVVVERKRGAAIERTVKRLKLTRAGYELWPESSDPNFSKPLSIQKTSDAKEVDGTIIEIVGLVIGAYRAF